MTNGWQKLTFKQTKAELMVRIASTLIFNKLVKANAKIVSVREITESVQYGYTDKSSAAEIGPKYVRITDLKDGQVNWDTVPYCKCDNPEQYLLEQGDLIFARTGATTGKTHLFRETPPVAVFASYLIRVRPTKEINPEYLYFFFQSDLYWSQISSQKEGSAQPNVNGQKLSNIELPIADEDTQKAICKFLAVVRARQDGVAQELPELPYPLNEQRSLMERIEIIAARITKAMSLREEADLEANAILLSALFHIFDTNSQHWKSISMPETLEINDRQVDPKLPEYSNLPHISGENMESKTCRLLPYRTAEQDGVRSSNYYFSPNTILYSKIRPYLRKAVYVDFQGVCSADVYPIKVNNPELDIKFVMWSLVANPFSEYAIKLSGRTRMPKLNRKQLFAFMFKYPPLDEQRRIVAYLDSVQARLASLRELQSETQEELGALLPSVLDRAFKGEL